LAGVRPPDAPRATLGPAPDLAIVNCGPPTSSEKTMAGAHIIAGRLSSHDSIATITTMTSNHRAPTVGRPTSPRNAAA
jgi:hypothetical protein